jgi:hypothetical protein
MLAGQIDSAIKALDDMGLEQIQNFLGLPFNPSLHAIGFRCGQKRWRSAGRGNPGVLL